MTVFTLWRHLAGPIIKLPSFLSCFTIKSVCLVTKPKYERENGIKAEIEDVIKEPRC